MHTVKSIRNNIPLDWKVTLAADDDFAALVPFLFVDFDAFVVDLEPLVVDLEPFVINLDSFDTANCMNKLSE